MLEINEIIKATNGKLITRGLNNTVRGISIDSRSIKPGHAFLAIKGNNFDGHEFILSAIRKGANCIIQEAKNKKTFFKNNNFKKTTVIEVNNTIHALGDLARLRRRQSNIPVIAVTGSNGKTTAKEMIAEVLSTRYRILKNEGTKNNHIGLPLTLLNLDKSHDLAVLEIGTNHFGEVAYLVEVCEPNIGLITNIGPSHLEYFGDLSGVFREKSSLIKKLNHPGIALLNSDDKFLRKELLKANRFPFGVSFGINNRADFSAGKIKLVNAGLEFSVNKKYKFTIKTLGYYNIYNALAAIAAGRIFGLKFEEIALALSNFDFLSGRLKVKKYRQAVFIDDTYNSNPLSLKQALWALGSFKTCGRKIFVMGDMMELGKSKEKLHAQAGRMLLGVCDVFIATGKLSRIAARAAEEMGFNRDNIFICSDSHQARNILFKKIGLTKKDVVLLKGSRSMKMEEVLRA